MVLTRPGDLRTGLSPDTGEPLLCDKLTTSGIVESCTLIILTSLRAALARLASEDGFGTQDMDAWRWGDLHRLTCETLLPADELNIPPPGDPDATLKGGYPRHGGIDAVDSSDPGMGDFDYTFGSGPVMRHITEFPAGGAPITRMAMPGGQSSDRASPHFRDLMDEYWAENEYFALPFATREIIDSGQSRMRLKPD
jgi:acyl-homoserine lactone acylase PvdQ